jgi:hypothetical protein
MGVYESFFGGCYAYIKTNPSYSRSTIYFDRRNRYFPNQIKDTATYFRNTGLFNITPRVVQ